MSSSEVWSFPCGCEGAEPVGHELVAGRVRGRDGLGDDEVADRNGRARSRRRCRS